MQFSLRSILLCVTVVAIYCSLLFAVPPTFGIAGLAFLSMLLVPASVGGIVYARGNWQAFWIGCTVGAAPMVFWTSSAAMMMFIPVYQGESDSSLGYMMAGWHPNMFINGLVVVFVRWVCLRQSRSNIALADRAVQNQ